MTDTNITDATELYRSILGERAYNAYSNAINKLPNAHSGLRSWNELAPIVQEAWKVTATATPIYDHALAEALYRRRCYDTELRRGRGVKYLDSDATSIYKKLRNSSRNTTIYAISISCSQF